MFFKIILSPVSVCSLFVQSILATRMFHVRRFAHSREIKCNPFFAIHGHLAAIHGRVPPCSVADGLQQGQAASLFSRLSFFIIFVINNRIQA